MAGLQLSILTVVGGALVGAELLVVGRRRGSQSGSRRAGARSPVGRYSMAEWIDRGGRGS